MSPPKKIIWNIEPHTIAKHKILEYYLQAWFPILGKDNKRINYIDGFSGPGRYSGGEEGSPLIALRVAKDHSFPLSCQLNFLFIDDDMRRVDNLKNEISQISLPSNFHVSCVNGEFHKVTSEILDEINSDNANLAPTFAFIDPFGFSGIPFFIVKRLLRINSVEVLITFMKDSINRFITDPNSSSHIIELFGSSDVTQIIKQSHNRILDLRKFYQKQLHSDAEFVRFFEMRDSNDRPIYDLFFATNHPLGHIKIKEAMWRFDDQGYFSFSDATNPNQVVLFKREIGKDLFQSLDSIRKGNRTEVGNIEKYVEDRTPFLSKHLKKALQYGEENGLITIDEFKKDGKKRRAKTFPGNAIINFVNKK